VLESWFGGDKNSDGNGIQRPVEAQAIIDTATQKLALYFYETCWFSGTVRSTIQQLALNIELRDIHQERAHYERLVSEGGRPTVPCLQIERDDGAIEWLYESRDISSYLETRFGDEPKIDANS
jgi:glutathione S-transferase